MVRMENQQSEYARKRGTNYFLLSSLSRSLEQAARNLEISSVFIFPFCSFSNKKRKSKKARTNVVMEVYNNKRGCILSCNNKRD